MVNDIIRHIGKYGFSICIVVFMGVASCSYNWTGYAKYTGYYYESSGEIKPLQFLKDTNEAVFNTINTYIPNDEEIKDYYYGNSIRIRLNETNFRSMTVERYMKGIHKYKDYEIMQIRYNIYYKEYLKKKYYNIYKGKLLHKASNEKCFTVIFDGGYNFKRMFSWP
jgi:hypothetical protein